MGGHIINQVFIYFGCKKKDEARELDYNQEQFALLGGRVESRMDFMFGLAFLFRWLNLVHRDLSPASQRQGKQRWDSWNDRSTGRCDEGECQNCLHVCPGFSDGEDTHQWLLDVLPHPSTCARGTQHTSQSFYSVLYLAWRAFHSKMEFMVDPDSAQLHSQLPNNQGLLILSKLFVPLFPTQSRWSFLLCTSRQLFWGGQLPSSQTWPPVTIWLSPCWFPGGKRRINPESSNWLCSLERTRVLFFVFVFA